MITRDDKFTYGPLYHWFFHAQPDVPEMLSHGKEREYLKHFFVRLVGWGRDLALTVQSYNPAFFTSDDLDVCTYDLLPTLKYC
jgi:hypothetical protein